MRKLFLPFLILTALFLGSSIVYGQDTGGGYNVPTELPIIKDVSQTKDSDSDVYKTIKQRCLDAGLPSQCCNPPDYSEAEECPIRLKRVITQPEPKQLNTKEEQDAYQSVLSCLQENNSDEERCIRNDTFTGITMEIDQKNAACAASCQNNFQNCNDNGCGVSGWTTPERYKAYVGWIECEVRQLPGWIPECQEAQKNFVKIMGGYNSDLYKQASSDFYNYRSSGGASLKPPPVEETDTACQNACLQRDACEDRCNNSNGAAGNEVDAAAHQALEDWRAGVRSGKVLPAKKPGPLAQKLADLEKTATPIRFAATVDFDGNEVAPEKLAQGLGDLLPSVRLGFSLKNIKEDEAVSLEIQKGLPIKKIVLTTSQPIDDGVVAVTVIDASRLQFQEVPQPEPSRYELKNYFQVDTTVNQTETHPWKEALFEFLLPLIPDQDFEDVEMLRWNRDQNEWDTLPIEQIGCGPATCRFISSSSGTSYFAIVVDKNPPSVVAYGITSVLFMGGLAYLVIWLVRKKGNKQKALPQNQIGIDLRSWPRRHPIMVAMITIAIVSASVSVIVYISGPHALRQLAVILLAGGVAWLIYQFKKRAKEKTRK